MITATLALSFSLFHSLVWADLPSLVVGETVEAEIPDTASEVRTPTLKSYKEAPTVGVEYRLVVDESGPYHIELRSYDFDPYLILRAAEGTLLAEDDDGLISVHSRLVVDLVQAVEYRLIACALHGDRGSMQLDLRVGRPPTLSPRESALLDVQEARAELAHLEREDGPEHPRTAKGLNALGLRLERLGQYSEARQVYERALAISETRLGHDHPVTAVRLTNLALLLDRLGEYSEARTLFERALEIREALFGPNDSRTARSMSRLAGLLLVVGEFSEARLLMEKALAICEAEMGPDHKEIIRHVFNLGGLLQVIGEYALARPLIERALAICEAQPLPDQLRVASVLNRLGSLLQASGEFSGARLHYGRALAIREAELGPDHVSTALSLHNLASMLLEMGRYEEARPLCERALAVFEARLGPDHPDTATALNNLAVLLEKLGEFAQARPLSERALAIREARMGPDHPETAQSLCNLAGVLYGLGEYSEARRLNERALAIRETRLGADNPSTAGDLNNLATLYLDLREPAMAWELLHRSQRGMVRHLSSILASRTRAESSQYLSRRRWELELLASVPRNYSSSQVEYEVAGALLAWKGQVGRAARGVRKLSRASDSARDLIARLRSGQEQLSLLAYDTELPRDVREQQVEVLRAGLDDLELELRERVDVGKSDALDVGDLCERLPANAALLSFFVHRVYEPARYEGDEIVGPGIWSESHLVAWVMRPGVDVVSVDLGPADRLAKETKGFLAGLLGHAPNRGIAVASRSDEDAGDALRTLLWDPLAEHLGDTSLVIVSHDRFTATLPLEVLQDSDGRYLIEDYSFVYLHDLQAIASFEEEVKHDYDSLFCVGGVDFDGRGEPERFAVADTRGELAAPTERWQLWRSLDGTRSEASRIHELHEVHVPEGSRWLVTGADATEERVLREMPRASLVHLATHGYFQPKGLPSMLQAVREEEEALRDSGRAGDIARMKRGLLETDRKLTGYLPEVLSGLVFAGANMESERGRLDGYLTAADVDWMDLSGVELVTLSACETGLGRSESGEGMSGFRTTFLRAGAETVVSSLWQVSDDSTEKLMKRFYENLLRDKLGKLEALREAQLWMLRENRRKYDGDGRPYTWGAFVLSGDWR